jgi:hypothetical protein
MWKWIYMFQKKGGLRAPFYASCQKRTWSKFWLYRMWTSLKWKDQYRWPMFLLNIVPMQSLKMVPMWFAFVSLHSTNVHDVGSESVRNPIMCAIHVTVSSKLFFTHTPPLIIQPTRRTQWMRIMNKGNDFLCVNDGWTHTLNFSEESNAKVEGGFELTTVEFVWFWNVCVCVCVETFSLFTGVLLARYQTCCTLSFSHLFVVDFCLLFKESSFMQSQQDLRSATDRLCLTSATLSGNSKINRVCFPMAILFFFSDSQCLNVLSVCLSRTMWQTHCPYLLCFLSFS